ncbi:MAG TPA: hypothetical protein VKB86_18835 [Pyrinomonadaceae bacterium]|nr:hypothetical protein [Pyrinomonadaceae bacterium]
MRLPLAFSVLTPADGDLLENLVLIGCGLLILVLALALCSFLFDKISKARSASASWLERRAARRRRRTCLKKYYPPVRNSHLRIVPPPDDSIAHNALRRAAEAQHVTQPSPSREQQLTAGETWREGLEEINSVRSRLSHRAAIKAASPYGSPCSSSSRRVMSGVQI